MKEALAQKPRKPVFCASLGDVFEDRRELDGPRERLWKIIEETDAGLDWLLLTKRPENIEKLIPASWLRDGIPGWLGVTTEDQTRANDRLPIALGIKARI